MLTKVEVRTASGSLLVLPLDDISDGLVLEDIDGLDPVKAVLVSSGFAQQDGEQYHSSRREPRNVVFKIGLEPDYVNYDVRDLRTRLYDYFMPKTPVNLRFYDSSGLVVDIDGRNETFETKLFSKDPIINISTMCFDPDFVELTPTVINGNTVSTTTETLIDYVGSVETGLLFTLNINRTLTAFSIYHRQPDGTLRSMDVAGSYLAGDVVKISTISGSKSAMLTRSGSSSSILNDVSPQSYWAELSKGNNYIRVYASGAAIPFSITYTPRYGGL